MGMPAVVALFHFLIPTEPHTSHVVHIVLRKLYFLPPVMAGVFDALISDRPYHTAMNYEQAAENIREKKGSQFDTTVVDVFEKIQPAEWEAIRKRYSEMNQICWQEMKSSRIAHSFSPASPAFYSFLKMGNSGIMTKS